MKRLAQSGLALAVCALPIACTPNPGPTDAGTTADAGVEADAGTVEMDAGTVEMDAGTVEMDAGTVEMDAGTVEMDAGTVEMDAGTVEMDAGVMVDAGVEMDAGVMVDAGVEMDAGVMVDAGVEMDAGAMADAGVEMDAGAMVDAGVEMDAGVNNDTTVADLRALIAAGGDTSMLDLNLDDVTVTYVRSIGFTLQDTAGDSLFVYTGGGGATPAMETLGAGDVVSIHVTSVGEFRDMDQVNGGTVTLVTANDGSVDVKATLAIDLSSGTAIEASHEAAIVKLTGATIESGADRVWTIQYGPMNTTTELYAYEATALGLCAGATADVFGYIDNNSGDLRIAAYEADDITNLDTTACAAAPTYDQSNWNFEDWTQTDPPEDFIKLSTAFSMTQETTIVDSGTSSANVTWTSTSNQDLEAGAFVPTAEGETASCNWRVYDNDPTGRGRAVIRFYDAMGSQVSSNKYSNAYTEDAAMWADYVYTQTTPAGATSFRCGMRLYDRSGFNMSATIYLDNLTASSTAP